MQHSDGNINGADNEINSMSLLSELNHDLLEQQKEVPPEQHSDRNDNRADNEFDESSHSSELDQDSLEQQNEIPPEQFKTITIEEYKKLMQLMLQVKKHEDTIKQMEEKIRLKDVQIKKLRISLDEKQCIRVGHLSNVSKSK